VFYDGVRYLFQIDFMKHSKVIGITFWVSLHIFNLGFNLGINPRLAYADASPSASVVPLEEFDTICKTTLEDKDSSTPQAAQKLQYCKAAKSAKEAFTANDTLWKVWAAVGGVCVSACALSFAGIGNQFVCIGVNVAAGVTDGVLTENFMGAMMAIGGSVAGYMVNESFSNNGKTAANDAQQNTKQGTSKVKEAFKAEQKDIGACIIAATAGIQIYMKMQAKETSKKTAETNLASAQALNESAATSTDTAVSAPTPTPDPTATNYAAGGSARPEVISGSSTSGSSGNPCSGLNTSNGYSNTNIGMAISCAIASDPNLPKYVSTPKFADDFKKSSGIDLGNFLNNSSSPEGAMIAASSGVLKPDQASRLGAAMKDLGQQVARREPNSAYSSGGGGFNHGGGSDPGMEGMLAGLMNQFMPKQEGDGSQGTSTLPQIIFANQNKPAASIPEDRTLSIFDRVTYRYYFVSPRMLQGGI
jgi:hypothetical protein